MTAGTRQLYAQIRGAAAAGAVFAILDNLAAAVSAFETSPGEWRLEAYPKASVLSSDLAARLALAAAAAGGALIAIDEQSLPERDWLAENQLAFPPLQIGRFFVYGSHYRGRVPVGAIGIALDAATAFGTGEHPSTQGCLSALEMLARRHRIAALLDIGAGTGILSIAGAKLLRRQVRGSDIDRGAVDVARHNIARNGVAKLVQVGHAPGYRGRGLRCRRHDLVLSNILARPLALLAVDLARTLMPGGRAVLSGLLRRQEPIVLGPHRGLGLRLERRIVIDGWSTLILHAGVNRQMTTGAAAPIYWLGRRSGLWQRPVRQPVGGRSPEIGEAQSSTPNRRPFDRQPALRGSASDECRYRPARGHRGPSDQCRRAVAGASRQTPFRLR